jgi:hypothetical protein
LYAPARNWKRRRSQIGNNLNIAMSKLFTPGPRRLVFAAFPSDPTGGAAKTSALKFVLELRSPRASV